MTKMIPITPQQFGGLRWTRPGNMVFAAHTPAAALSASELAAAALAFPMAFLPEGEGFTPVALLGLRPQENLFVAPDGRWLGRHLPAALRAHPFAFVQTADGQQRVLCVDQDSGLVTQADASTAQEGAPFFDDEGQPAQALREVLEMLRQMDAGRGHLQRATEELRAQSLIQPWPLQWQDARGATQSTGGLHRIDEAALQKVSDEAFLRLRHAGALPLAYAQLLSMHNIGTLAQLAAMRTPKPSGQDDLSFLSKDGVLHFGN